MKLKMIALYFLFFSSILYAQSIIVEKEILSRISIGEKQLEVSYILNEEGFFAPEGPMIDAEGRIIFYPSSTRDALRVFNNGKWTVQPLYSFLQNATGYSLRFISQQGYIGVRELLVVLEPGYGSFTFSADTIKRLPVTYAFKNYPMPFGSIFESTNPPFVYSTEVRSDRSLVVRDIDQTRTWISSQLGGFSIGSDNLLYRNGILWSAMPPKDPKYRDGKYIGRINGGFCLWAYGFNGQECFFVICRPDGTQELDFELPWGKSIDRPLKFGSPIPYYNYGLGPWGELYCLVPPLPEMVYDGRSEAYWPQWNAGSAELVVVRNHLKYFGRLTVDSVRLRKEASTSSAIIGTYPAKTGFRILETGTVKETIGGQTNVWYKVRLLDGTEGWFFGAFVANLYDGPGTPPPWPNIPDW